MISKNKTFKRLVESYLRKIHEWMLENEPANYFGDVLVQAYPMVAFACYLEWIENRKDLPECLNWKDFKNNLIKVLRVGNAVLPRHEWFENNAI